MSGGRARDAKKTVLVVARDAIFRARIARTLIPAGYLVELAENDRHAREVAGRADVAILLPDGFGSAGPELARKLAESARGLIIASDRPEGLAHPFDGCVRTSADAQEILARVSELSEADSPDASPDGGPETIGFEGFTLDFAGHVLLDADGREVPLTSTEFALLATFSRSPGRALSRDQLRGLVGGRGVDAFDRSIDVMILRLRRKIEPDPKAPSLILTVPGVGYKFVGKARDAHAAPVATPFVAADVSIAAEPKFAQSVDPRPAERRQLTVMACEFVGLSALSGRLDPEDLSAVTQTRQKRCTDIIESWRGHIASSSGDGLIAYFGEPQADEHDAECALRAGLELIDPESRADDTPAQERLRVGIATGLVVIEAQPAGGGATAYAAVGEAPYLAQRLKQAADPDGLIVAQSTRDLVRGLFEYRDLGSLALEGYPDGVPASQVLRPSATESRFEAQRDINGPKPRRAAAQRALTPFVGRNRELEALTRRHAESVDHLCVIEIAGDPGIGKSRLLHELRETLIDTGVFVLSGSCWPDSQQTAFRPFIEVVRRSFRISDADRDAEIARKFEQTLSYLGIATAENVGLLLNLLGLKAESLAGLDGVLIGLRTRDLLLALLRERSRTSRLAVLLEDLHWIDRASQELISRLIDSEDALPLLLVNTFRPEYRPPWAGHHRVVTIALAPLPVADTARIAEARLALPERDAALVALITERAEGNPLFAEEIANFLVEQTRQPAAAPTEAAATSSQLKLPASLQSLLTARVHRLAQTDRSLLRAASVIGRRFSADLLAAVTSTDANLDARLAAMQAADLIHREAGAGTYMFKHALVRDALYESLLTPARAELHLKVATEIERRVTARPIEAAEILAHHYVQTSRTDKAVEFLALAGRKSSGLYSLAEAEQFLRQALTLSRAGQTSRHDAPSMDILADLTKVLTLAFKTRDIIALVEPDIDAILALDDNAQVPVVLYFYGFALFTICRFEEGRRIQESGFLIANRQCDPRARAYAAAGLLFLAGATEPLPDADFERIVDAAYADAERANDVHAFGTTLLSIAWAQFNQGRVRQAAEWADRLLLFGRERRDPRSMAISLWLLGWCDLLREDYASALTHAESSVAIAATQVDRMHGSVIIGYAQIATGKVAEGAALIGRVRDEALANQWLYMLTGIEVPIGLAMVLSGEIAKGLSRLNALVGTYGNVAGTDLGRLLLAEIYTTLLLGERRPPFGVFVKNFFAVVKARIMASRKAERLLNVALKNPHFSEQGIFRARIELQFGRLYRARKEPEVARVHLERAHAIASEQDAPKLLARIEAELARLRRTP